MSSYSHPLSVATAPLPVAAVPSGKTDESIQASGHIEALTRVALRAATSAEALQQTAEYLRQQFRGVCILLETREEERVRHESFGAEIAFGQFATPALPASYPHVILPLKEIPGTITYVFAEGSANPPEVSSVTRDLLETLTACLSLRIANENLRRRADHAEKTATRRLREVAAIYDIGQALAPMPNAPMLQMIVERTALLMEAQACSLMLIEAAQNHLHVAASHGLPLDVRAQTQLLGEGVAGRVAQTEEPLRIGNNVPLDARLEGVVLKPGLGSAILVPMKDQESRVLGVLCIRRRPEKSEFTDEEVKLFHVFATQAALALSNARLVDDLNRRAGELQKISMLSRALISTIDLETLLTTAVEDVCNVVGCDRCCLYWRDSSRPLLVPRLLRGYPESVGRNPVKLGEGAVGLAARSKLALHFDSQETVTPEEAQSLPYRQMKGFARSLGTSAFIAIPILTSKETCIGVFVADNKTKRTPISIEQRDLLQAFVSQAGIAMENALLYEQMQDSVANLRRLKDYTDNVLQSIEAAILTADGRGNIVRCNRAAEATLHCPAKNLRDLPLADALANLRLPQEEADHLVDLVLHVLETGERIHRLKLTLHPFEQPAMTVYLMVSRLPDHRPERGGQSHSDRTGVVIIFEDVTLEARLEAELEKMRRLADIGQLAAKMAHEVRNALSPIKGAAQLIRSEMEYGQQNSDREKGRQGDRETRQKAEATSVSVEWPDMIIAEVDGLSRLTGEMLDFARPTPIDPRPVSMNAFLQTCVVSLAGFLEEHQVRLQWELAENNPDIRVDAIQLGQVVRNLVMNAAQSMAEGGTLTIRTEWDMGGMVAISFEDTGVGIPVEDLERIFRPFVTTRPKGTGLGLPIVQKIVDHHGGRVEVRSEVGKGTCFVVWLPLNPLPQENEPDAPLIYGRVEKIYPDR